jgi:hypothetical protein
MSPADHAIVGSLRTERHEVEFSAVWDSGDKRKTWFVVWNVTNLHSVTA